MGTAGKIGLVVLGVVILFLLVVGGTAIGTYNSLIAKLNFVDQQWSNIESNLQRRADLIPNLVNTVKGYARLEEGVLTKIAESRSKILSPTASPEEKIAANNEMTEALRQTKILAPGNGGILGTGGRFLSLVEQYPQLKSDQQFLRLQDELAGTENRLNVARRDYNAAAADYNTTRQRFPTVVIATLLNFQQKPLFKAEEGSRTAPKVDFGK
ncbi:MAG TPA: LemA family protein [Blastocatellia bacterium]|nr:LemA family protein [Blastocatellia bacterium]